MDIEIDIPGEPLADDILRGAVKIGKFIDEPPWRVYYLAEKQILPIGRLGSGLIASKRRLRERYTLLTQGAEPQPHLAHRQARPHRGRRRDCVNEARARA